MTAAESKVIAETLDTIVGGNRSLEKIIKDSSEHAHKNGLTTKILEQLLNEK